LLTVEVPEKITFLRLSPKGTRLAAANAEEPTTVVVVALPSGKEAQTQRPIAAASVSLADWHDGPVSRALTDAEGTARLNHTFTTVGTDGVVQHTGGYRLWRTTLKVEAKGYLAVQASLEEHLGSTWSLYGPSIPPVVVLLSKKRPAQEQVVVGWPAHLAKAPINFSSWSGPTRSASALTRRTSSTTTTLLGTEGLCTRAFGAAFCLVVAFLPLAFLRTSPRRPCGRCGRSS
jgi:hypothetical protein